MNTNAVAYKKIWDSVKKKYVNTKFHKDNPNMFKGGDVKIHPGAKKDSSKDAPKKKLTLEERKKAMRDRAKARHEQFKKDRAAKKAGKKTSYEGYKSAYDKRQAQRKEALKIKAKKKHEAWKKERKNKKDNKTLKKANKNYWTTM